MHAHPDARRDRGRFLIELTDSEEARESLEDMSLDMADYMLGGDCGNAAFEASLTQDEMFFAWRSTCLMYFEEDLTDEQIAETELLIAERGYRQERVDGVCIWPRNVGLIRGWLWSARLTRGPSREYDDVSGMR